MTAVVIEETGEVVEMMTVVEAERITAEIQDRLNALVPELRRQGEELQDLRKEKKRLEGSKTGSVYFIQARRSCAIKIGFAIDPNERLRDLQTACPERLVLLGSLPGSLADEHALHRRFDCSRIRGEWFEDDQAIIDFIEEYCS